VQFVEPIRNETSRAGLRKSPGDVSTIRVGIFKSNAVSPLSGNLPALKVLYQRDFAHYEVGVSR
jgi:hypothetical protein